MSSSLAKTIVDAIVNNLTDRKGLRHEWDNIDADVELEIRDEWAEIVDASIASLMNPGDAAIEAAYDAVSIDDRWHIEHQDDWLKSWRAALAVTTT